MNCVLVECLSTIIHIFVSFLHVGNSRVWYLENLVYVARFCADLVAITDTWALSLARRNVLGDNFERFKQWVNPVSKHQYIQGWIAFG